MIKFFLIFLVPYSIYAAKILNYNIYDRTDRVDIMVTFDEPFKGIIKQSKKHSKIIIKLYDAEIDSSKIKKLSTKFIRSITITPMFEYTQIVVNVPSSVSLIASKTSDSYGLRLRFTEKNSIYKKDILDRKQIVETKKKKETLDELKEDEPLSLPTKGETVISKGYYITIFLLLIGIVILLLLKKRLIFKKDTNNINPWLFKENTTKSEKKSSNQPMQEPPVTDKKTLNNVSIRFQKEIDDNNSVIMLDFGKDSYLILLGNGNILLDKFTDEQPNTQQDFEEILQARSMELNQLIKEPKDEVKEPLQAYKERASSIAYGEDL